MPKYLETTLEFFVEEIDSSTFILAFELQGERLVEYQRTFTTKSIAILEGTRILKDILKVLGKHVT